MAAYTTQSLLDNIDRRAFSPTNQNTYTQAERLALITEEMETNVFPSIFNLYEEYYVTQENRAIVANQIGYRIPARAVNGQIRELKLVNSSGDYRDLPRIEVEDLYFVSSPGTPERFYLRNNKINLHPTPSGTTETLLIDFYVSPGTSVLPSATAVITAINTSTNVVSFSSIPSTFVTGATFDFIRGIGEHEHIGLDFTSTLVSGTDVTFSSLPADIVVGDYMSLQGESSLIQCPTVYRNVLAQYVAARIIMDSGQSGGGDAFAKAEKMKAEAEKLIRPRVTGALKSFSKIWGSGSFG